ncbi:MAG TPA: glycosyltransferase family 39 protein [Thermoanaerobaculia bacterium]
MADTGLPARTRRRVRWDAVLGAVLLAAYGAFLVRHAAFAVGGADSSGYANEARRMKTGALVDRPRSLDRLGLPDGMAQICIPLGFVTGPRPGTMASTYPPGFPAHLLAAGSLAGWRLGPYLVSPVAAMLTVFLVFLLGRDLGLSRLSAGAAAAIFAAWPVFLFQALQPMSDAVATLWSVAAILFARRASHRSTWAFLAGAAFGIAVLVRPADALLALPLAFALSVAPRALALFAAGGIPFAGALAAYDLHTFGSVVESGYGKLGLLHEMALRQFPPRIAYYGAWVIESLTPLVPLAWLALPADRRVPIRDRWLLLSWFGSFLLFYSFYKPYESFIYVRFLLPGAPAIVLGAALVASSLLIHTGRARRWLGGIALAVVLCLEVRVSRRVGVLQIVSDQTIYPEICRWANTALPRRSVLFTMQASGALEYYTDATYVVWVWVDGQRFRSLRPAIEGQGWQWFALLFPDEQDGFFKQVPGTWTQIGERRGVTLWKLEP